MKILLINKYLFPKGGDAISTLNTGRLLEKNGHNVVYWGMKHPKNPKYPFEKYFTKNSDYNSDIGILEKIRLASNLLYSFEAKKKIDEVIKRTKPDIVHLNNFAHQISPSILHTIRTYDLPSIATLHDFKYVCASYLMMDRGGTCERCNNKRYYRCLTSKCVKGSTGKSLLNTIEMYLHHSVLNIYSGIQTFLSPSQFMIQKMQEMGFQANFIHLPNFIDIQHINPVYRWRDQSIFYLGRLSREKGLLTLLEAMRGLDNIQLKIIGDGPQRNELEVFVKRHSITNVNFLGYLSGENLKREMTSSMALVIPSECYENNPLAVLESFAYGKPAIGADIGGIPELVKHMETGYTFKPRDANDLRKTIKQLVGNRDNIDTMGKRARSLVEDEFSSIKYYSKLKEVYNAVI